MCTVVPHWTRYKELIGILDASLQDIVDRWADGKVFSFSRPVPWIELANDPEDNVGSDCSNKLQNNLIYKCKEDPRSY